MKVAASGRGKLGDVWPVTTRWPMPLTRLKTSFQGALELTDYQLGSLRFQGKSVRLKGQCHAIFDFLFFSWISFPQASEYTITAISIFFENSRRYSQLKVHHRCQRHRWQMEKNFKQKIFNNFVWAPLGSRVNIYINFCLQVHFKVSAAWYCPHYLPPVSLIPVAICHRCQQHKRNWWQNLPPVSLIPVANSFFEYEYLREFEAKIGTARNVV